MSTLPPALIVDINFCPANCFSRVNNNEYRERVVIFTALVEMHVHFIKYQRYCDLAKLKVVIYTVCH